MKKIALLIMLFAGFSTLAGAQTLKFGHINSNELVSLMSEMDSARVKLQAYQNDLIETMQGMQDEYTAKLNDYQRKQSTWTPALKETKEKEIQDLVQRLQQFEQTAQQEMQQMQQVLMGPVMQQAQEAINKVAKANNLTYVFDLAASAVIYKDDSVSIDLLPLAKKELGIPAEKVAPTQLPQTAE